MAVTSSIVEEKQGKGHTDHGNGKGKGHEKHADKAMADGVYTINISGVADDNDTPIFTPAKASPLADGSTFFTEARSGSVTSTDQGLVLQTDNGNGRLRAGVEFDQDNRVTLGNLETLSFDFTQLTQTGSLQYSPAFRLNIDADGNLATTNDRGELVFEYAYQDLGNVPLNSLVEVDLVGADWVAWQANGGTNRDQINNMTTFSDWSDANGYRPINDPDGDGPRTAGTALTFNENSLVLGFSIGLGSGPGSGTALVDDVKVAGVTYDFFA